VHRPDPGSSGGAIFPSLALTTTCKQAYFEASPIFLETNSFRVRVALTAISTGPSKLSIALRRWLEFMSNKYSASPRHMTIVLGPWPTSLSTGCFTIHSGFREWAVKDIARALSGIPNLRTRQVMKFDITVEVECEFNSPFWYTSGVMAFGGVPLIAPRERIKSVIESWKPPTHFEDRRTKEGKQYMEMVEQAGGMVERFVEDIRKGSEEAAQGVQS